MQYTLKQAIDLLSSSSHAYGVTDTRRAINRAIQSLAGLAAWECLRKTVRFVSAGPEFSLPQGCAGLVRVCVNGHPRSVRGRDFRFLQSGPGDMARPPFGFHRVPQDNVLDLGWSPVIYDPAGPVRLFAYSDGRNEPPLHVRGVSPSGREVSADIIPYIRPAWQGGYETGGVDYRSAIPTDEVFQTITEVVVDDSATAYSTLYAVSAFDDGVRYAIGQYHPEVKAPQFRRYAISGVGPTQPVEILAETRVDPLPLIADSDVLPIPAIDPVEWMIRYDWCMKAGEADAAAKYQAQAAQWLKAQEVVDNTVQTPMVVNALFDGSMGEISEEAFNV